jgi:hypothetical protein
MPSVNPKTKQILTVALVVIGVLLLAYLLRNVSAPPNCELEPDNPACRETPR